MRSTIHSLQTRNTTRTTTAMKCARGPCDSGGGSIMKRQRTSIVSFLSFDMVAATAPSTSTTANFEAFSGN